MSLSSAGFFDGNDYLDYMESLHLPADKIAELGLEADLIPGDDKPGDYRAAGIEWVPIEPTVDLANVRNPSERALYYNTLEGQYYQYTESGGFMNADKNYVQKVLDEKAYINMPNQRYFNFLNPRTFRVGIKFSF